MSTFVSDPLNSQPSDTSQPFSEADLDALIDRASNIVAQNEFNVKEFYRLTEKIDNLNKEIQDKNDKKELYARAGTLIGTATDRSITRTLNVITGVINRSLEILFPKSPRSIDIQYQMYRDMYPHFVVTLFTGVERKARKFTQSGRGIAQIVSFLFLVTLIDARKARPLLLTDELLSGLHPHAKAFVRDIIQALKGRFQFVMAEYSLDVGKEYLVEYDGTYSSVTHYEDGDYYAMLVREGLIDEDGNLKTSAKEVEKSG